MNDRFDNWIRTTLQPREGDGPAPRVDVRDLVMQARGRRSRRRLRLVLSVSTVVLAGIILLAVTPDKTGSSSARLSLEKVLADGRLKYSDPLSGDPVYVRSEKEGDWWARVKERTAANEEEIVGASFIRYKRLLEYTVVYQQYDPKEQRLITDVGRSAVTPKARSPKKESDVLRKIFTDVPTATRLFSGEGMVFPDERHRVDGIWFRIKVRGYDVPGVGMIYFGEGVREEGS